MELGPYCQALGLTEDLLINGVIGEKGTISNGVAIELKDYCDKKAYSTEKYIEILSSLDLKNSNVNPRSVVSKLNRLKEQKKKLHSKKKVKGYTNVSDLLTTNFIAPINTLSPCPNIEPTSTSSPSPNEGPTAEALQSNVCNSSVAETDQRHSTCTIGMQTELVNKDNSKHMNMLQYEINKKQQVLDQLVTKIEDAKKQLDKRTTNIGHYSVKNINKRDERARKNMNKLRDLQRLVLKQKTMIENKLCDKKHILDLNNEMESMKDKIEMLNRKVENEKAKKLSVQKTNSYLRGMLTIEKLKDAATVQDDDSTDDSLKIKLLKSQDEIEFLQNENEQLKEQQIGFSCTTKNEDGSFSDSLRLCVIELFGLEISMEKIPSAIEVVSKHLFSHLYKKSDLPTPTTFHRNIIKTVAELNKMN